MNWKEIEPKIQKLQHDLLESMEWVKTHSEENKKYPQPSEFFGDALELLRQNEHDVVVCGEVKKGKSSMLNAIIGKKLLPVDSDVATCQVFRIANCDQESFELVFSDGSRKPITQDKLEEYGSQVNVNLQGNPDFEGKTLSYIQVNTPVAFLPKGVNMVDTPGLGSVYKTHEYITQNYISHASAVVFVLSPACPLIDQEIAFIEKVLDITPYILFVMTQADKYTEEVVDAVMRRDEEIMLPIYKAHGLNHVPQIIPFSSKALMDSVTAENERSKSRKFRGSNFQEFKERLFILLCRAVGLLRTKIALAETANQVNKVNAYIAEMANATVVDKAQVQREIAEKKKQLQQQIQEEQGSDPASIDATRNEIKAICNSIPNRVQQITASTGNIYKNYYNKINQANSRSELESLCQSLPQSIKSEVESQWINIAEEVANRVSAVLNSVHTEMEQVMYKNTIGEFSIDIPETTAKDKFNAFRTKAYGGFFGGSVASIILGAFDVASGGLITIITGAVAAIGWMLAPDTTLAMAKQKVLQGFSQAMNQIHSDLVNIGSGGSYSMVGQYANDLYDSASKKLDMMIKDSKTQLQQSLEDIESQAIMEAEKKLHAHKEWMSVKAVWDKETERVKSIMALRQEIYDEL